MRKWLRERDGCYGSVFFSVFACIISSLLPLFCVKFPPLVFSVFSFSFSLPPFFSPPCNVHGCLLLKNLASYGGWLVGDVATCNDGVVAAAGGLSATWWLVCNVGEGGKGSGGVQWIRLSCSLVL